MGRWTKVGEMEWKDNENKGYFLRVIKSDKRDIWAVFWLLGDAKFGYLDWKKLSKDFKKESLAINFAKGYVANNG